VLSEFQVFTAASMKMAAFWVVTPCSLVEVYQKVLAASIIGVMSCRIVGGTKNI
jgi:hypothetical protein